MVVSDPIVATVRGPALRNWPVEESMSWKNIKTRRQLTQYLLILNQEAGIQLTLNAPILWTEDPVSESEVATAIHQARADAQTLIGLPGRREPMGNPNSASNEDDEPQVENTRL
jgi:hypothetical protein